MKTINDLVCTSPFPFTGAQTQDRGNGLKTVANYNGLVPLRVLADGPDGLKPGDVVYVHGTDVKTPYGSSKFKLPSGEECIFVPKMQVLLVLPALSEGALKEAAIRGGESYYCKACGLPRGRYSNIPLCNCLSGKLTPVVANPENASHREV